MSARIRNWPCDQHEAHAPHPVRRLAVRAPDASNDYAGAVYVRDCPGVKAHPDTMIGRGSVPEVDVVVRVVAR